METVDKLDIYMEFLALNGVEYGDNGKILVHNLNMGDFINKISNTLGPNWLRDFKGCSFICTKSNGDIKTVFYVNSSGDVDEIKHKTNTNSGNPQDIFIKYDDKHNVISYKLFDTYTTKGNIRFTFRWGIKNLIVSVLVEYRDEKVVHDYKKLGYSDRVKLTNNIKSKLTSGRIHLSDFKLPKKRKLF